MVLARVLVAMQIRELDGMLDGKIALVVGGSRGIGGSTSLALAEAGADVAVAGRDADAASRKVAEIEAIGRKGLAIEADIGETSDIDQMIGSVVSAFGGVDIVVHNAGVTLQGGLLDIDEDTWELMQRVNAKGTFFSLQRAARQMIDQGRGGRIINISSIGSKGFRRASSPAYAASKGAVNALTYMAAVQLAPHRINVNAICPGVIETDLMRSVFDKRSADTGKTADELLRELERSIPLGRIGDPRDIASMVVSLSGPSGSYITGQTINIDGGLIMS